MIPSQSMVKHIASGDVGLMIDGADKYFVLSLRDYKVRGITEPPVSTVLRGPREGFVEDMKVNMTMLRRRFKTPDLVFDLMQVGKYSGTQIAVAYLDGVAEPAYLSAPSIISPTSPLAICFTISSKVSHTIIGSVI